MMCKFRKLFFVTGVVAVTIGTSAVVGASNAPSNGNESNSNPTSNSISNQPPKAHELSSTYTFAEYVTHFHKAYPSPQEYDRRSKIFTKNRNKILKHNEGRMTETGEIKKCNDNNISTNNDKKCGGYVMGVNRFTDMEHHEIPLGYNKLMHPAWRSQLMMMMGREKISQTERRLGSTSSYMVPPDFDIDEIANLPESVDWTQEGVINPIIPSQGGCGSCWTFAATGTIEAHLAIATGENPMSLSEENLLRCSPDPDMCGGSGGCSGATVELAYNYVADMAAKKSGGMYYLDDVPYEGGGTTTCKDITKGKTPAVGIKGWTTLPQNDYNSTMNALAKVGPLAIAVAAGDWSFYEKGILDTADTVINHAVILAGYGIDDETGEKYYLIRNSWGQNFGEDGYIRIKRTDDDSNVCGMDKDPLVGIACALDDNGNKIDVKPVEVCSASGVIFDVAYPVGAYRLD